MNRFSALSGVGPRRVRGPFLLALCALAAAGAVAAQDPGQPSLRLSDQLSLGSVAARPEVAPKPAAAIPQGGSPQGILRDYRIGPDDLIEIQVFGVDLLTRSVRVNGHGFISLPLIGNVEIGGLTAQQAEDLVVAKLKESYLQDPQVSLFIKEYTSQRVTIEGAVNKPGVYPLRGPTTLLQSLAVAGGQANLSDMAEVMLFRADASGNRQAQTYDVDRIRAGELGDPAVVNDDLIVVKRVPSRVLLKDSIIRDVVDLINPFRW
jgi:polysaccharide export outer membrane protein